MVKILSMDRGQVVIGIKAPRHVPVHREEIQRRIDAGSVDAKRIKPPG